jgi:sulfite reductase (NADPH) hemoprotein beta-component
MPTQWVTHIHSSVRSVCQVIEFAVWDPEAHPTLVKPKLGRRHKKTGEPHPDTIAVSPTGTTALAWDQGARRIGVLGVDRKGEEYYQITVGGSPDEQAALGDIVGKSLPSEEVAPAIQRTLDRYLEIRTEGERFIDTVRRVGPDPFRDAIYETLDAANA